MTSGFDRDRLGRLGAVLRARVEDGALAGAVALVARGDNVHVESVGFQDLESRSPMRRDSIFRIASMTKPVLAAAAMILVEEAQITLDEPIDRWLPELADRKVLRAVDAPLDDTVPARRSVTLRDLLTLRFGLGIIMTPGTYPIEAAIEASGLAPSPFQPEFSPDDFMARIGRLPLIHQPGEGWLYHTAYEVLPVLIARVAGTPLEAFLTERIFAPLGMIDTGFHVREESFDRFTTGYAWDGSGERLVVADEAAAGGYAKPPGLPSELVSTADDYRAFARMLLAGGRGSRERVLSRASVALMMTDQITPAQKAAWPFVPGFWDSTGWGFGGGITTRRDDLVTLGSYGWTGGFGTAFVADPAENLVAMLLTQRLMRGPEDVTLARRVFALAYAAIED